MILSADRIRDLLRDPPPDPAERLVIAPILDPNSQLKAGSAAIDVRLGPRFHVPLRTKLSQLNRLAEEHQRNLQKYKDETFVPIGDHFVLHPRQFVLGETLEWVRLPKNLSAYVVGRSTWGRDGLVIATAIGVHPGFAGILTLEISNIGEIPIYLHPGLAIAQLFLSEVIPGSSETTPVPSAFQGQTGPRGRETEVGDEKIIKEFQRRLKG